VSVAGELTAALDEIRDRHAARIKNAPGLGAYPADAERLLAAAEAVLKLADSARGVHWGGRYLGWDLDPAKVREAITRALDG
jgi:hypothetical protein